MMRRELIEMHLFGTHAIEEKALCGEDTFANDRTNVGCYERMVLRWGLWIVCERCKALTVPFALNVSRGLEADGQVSLIVSSAC